MENPTTFFCDFFSWIFYSEFFLGVLTPADLWYLSWFPRYRHVTVFVTQQELGILVVGLDTNTATIGNITNNIIGTIRTTSPSLVLLVLNVQMCNLLTTKGANVQTRTRPIHLSFAALPKGEPVFLVSSELLHDICHRHHHECHWKCQISSWKTVLEENLNYTFCFT